MTEWQWVERIPEVLSFTWPDLARVFIGAFLIGFMAVGWVFSIRKAAKAQIRAEDNRRAAEAEREREMFRRQIAELNLEHEKAERGLREEATQANGELEKATAELTVLQKRLTDLESFDGKLWEKETPATPPAFVNITDRKTRFISIVNLKGGVGKTTITANVGVSLARRSHKVLLVDLDFQGSLTRLCVANGDQLREIIEKKRTSARLLDGQINPQSLLMELTHGFRHANLVGQRCDFIAADERLAEEELKSQARWLITETPDARFLFRNLFHSGEVLSQYDFVMFDCPPRLTTACVNALHCSDFVLLPVLLEQGSIEAIPRTLNWLNRLPHVSRVRLLGVVANRVDLYANKPVSAQQTNYDYLPETLNRSGFNDGSFFRAFVPNKPSISHAWDMGQIAAADNMGMSLFQDVTDKVESGVR